MTGHPKWLITLTSHQQQKTKGRAVVYEGKRYPSIAALAKAIDRSPNYIRSRCADQFDGFRWASHER